MKSRFLRKSQKIQLNSKSLNNIFFCLKNEGTKEEVIENFLFEVNMDEKALNKQIKIPDHIKYLRFKTEYESFDELFLYFYKNKKDNYIIPFLGQE